MHLTLLGGEEYKGLIIGLFTIAALISRPFSGKLADTIGRLSVIFVGTFVTFIMGALYPFVHTVGGFLWLRFFHGFSTGFQPTGTTAYVADIVPFDKRGEALGYLGVFGSLGMASGPYLGPIIAGEYGMDSMFFVSSAAALISMLCLVGIKETLPSKVVFRWRHLAIWNETIVDPSVYPAAITMILTTFSFGLVLTIIPDYSDYLGFENNGIYFLIFTLSSIASRILGGKASDRIGRVPVIKFAIFLIILSMLALAYTDSRILFYASGVLFGLGVGMNTPSIFAWTIDLGKAKERAKGVATVYMGLEAGIFLGSMVSAFIYNNRPENFHLSFLSGGICAILALSYLFIYEYNRTKNPKNTKD